MAAATVASSSRDEGLDGDAVAGRGAQEREVARAGEGEVERAGDGGGAHGEDVDEGAEAFEALFVGDAEALLLVDDEQAEILEGDVLGEEGVGADEDVHLALGGGGAGLLALAAGAEAREHLDAHGEVGHAVAEGGEVLLGEDGGGGEEGHLLVVGDGDEGRAHGDLGLAIAGVAAEEAVHGGGRGHVALDLGDDARLVGRLLPGEESLELGDPGVGEVEGEAGHHAAAGLGLEEAGGEILDAALGGLLLAAPAFAVERVELDLAAVRADVAREEVRVGGGHVEARAAGVFQGEDLGAAAVDLDFVQPQEAADAVLQVHHQLAGLHVEGIFQALPRDGFGAGRGAPGAGRRVEVALRRHRQPEVRQREPLGEALRQELHLRVRRQFAGQQLPRGGALGADEHRAPPAGLGVQLREQGFAQAGVEIRVVRAAVPGQIPHAPDGLGHQCHGGHPAAQRLARPADAPAQRPGLRGEPLGVGLPLGDERELRERGLHGGRVLHPERGALELRQELRGLDFGRRGGRQGEALEPRHGALGRGVEGPQAVHRVAKELRAHGLGRARGPDVEDAAAQGEGQRLGH